MGKKYIIELLDDFPSEFKGIIVFGLTPSNQISAKPIPVEDLTPYTEPDLERVRKEAYDEGYVSGSKEDYDEAYLKGYNQGLADAWEAARKIIRMPEGDLLDLFDVYSSVCTPVQVMLKYDASEVIAKIKEYEDGKQEIKVGDIVRLKSAPEIEIWVTNISDEDGGRLSGLALKSVGDNCEIGDTYAYREIYMFERTGKHYDVATVLEKMREGQE